MNLSYFIKLITIVFLMNSSHTTVCNQFFSQAFNNLTAFKSILISY